jgi:hypothetical protein
MPLEKPVDVSISSDLLDEARLRRARLLQALLCLSVDL